LENWDKKESPASYRVYVLYETGDKIKRISV